jgi:hypothetical protein
MANQEPAADNVKQLFDIGSNIHQGLETTEIARANKGDINRQQGPVKPPSDSKLAGLSSTTESPPQMPAAEEISAENEYEPAFITRYWRKYRPFGHGIIWLLLTASVCDC